MLGQWVAWGTRQRLLAWDGGCSGAATAHQEMALGRSGAVAEVAWSRNGAFDHAPSLTDQSLTSEAVGLAPLAVS